MKTEVKVNRIEATMIHLDLIRDGKVYGTVSVYSDGLVEISSDGWHSDILIEQIGTDSVHVVAGHTNSQIELYVP